MKAKVILFSNKSSEITNFLNKFYSNKSDHGNSTSWQKEFPNPVEITEFIAAFADNKNSFDITMWVCLDEDLLINVTKNNVDDIIRYLYERFPY